MYHFGSTKCEIPWCTHVFVINKIIHSYQRMVTLSGNFWFIISDGSLSQNQVYSDDAHSTTLIGLTHICSDIFICFVFYVHMTPYFDVCSLSWKHKISSEEMSQCPQSEWKQQSFLSRDDFGRLTRYPMHQEESSVVHQLTSIST